MRYRELLELYKNRKLDEEKTQQVSRDIEQHEAISEYLFERDECQDRFDTDFGESSGDSLEQPPKSEDREADKFAKIIRKSMRRVYIKIGTVAVIASILVILFILFALPNMVSQFYYDPGKNIGEETNQMSLDMAVYSELWYPGYERTAVDVTDRGYGNYDIVIPQAISITGDFNTVVGKIEKNKMTLYNPDLLVRATGNAFAWEAMAEYKEGDTLTETTKRAANADRNGWVYDSPKMATDDLKTLDGDTLYIGYVTFDKLMSYEDFDKFMYDKAETNPEWCVARMSNESGFLNNIGFSCNPSSPTDLKWDGDRYPYLKLQESEDSNIYSNVKKESYMKTHFISMLRYMSEQKDFSKAVGEEGYVDDGFYKQAADYIEKNGISVYGCAVIVKKDTLIKLNKYEEVYGIYAKELK